MHKHEHMPRFAFTLAFFLLAWGAQAASLENPVITTAYYNATYVGYPISLHSLNNNNVAIGEALESAKNSISSAVTYNVLTRQFGGALFEPQKTFRFSILNDNGTYVGYGQLNNYNGGFIGSSTQFQYFNAPFTPLNVPGAISTLPNSINDSGVVVGGYISSVDGLRHGFIYRPDGTFETLDDPALKGTTLVGINSSGQIVGQSGNNSGFLYSGGMFTQLGFGLPMAINDAGAIAMYVDGNFTGQLADGGVLYPNGTLALTFLTGSYASPYTSLPFAPEAINDQGDLIFNSAYAFVAMPIAPEPASLRLLLCAAAAASLIGIDSRRKSLRSRRKYA